MTKTGVILQAGHWKASVHQLLSALEDHRLRLEQLQEELDLDSLVVLLTEMSPNKYDHALIEWADENGWHAYHPSASGPDECAILSQQPIRRQFYFLLTHLTLDPKVTNRTAPLFVTAAQPQGDGWFAVWHSPAHNQGLRPGNRATRVYRRALRGLKVWRMRVGRGGVSICGDWNVDLRRGTIRKTLSARFPRMEFAGDARQRPTQGGRVIDGLLTNRPVIQAAKTLLAQPGFDHKPTLTILG